MAELKTKATDASVADFIEGLDGEARRGDCRALIALMQETTGAEPKLWGTGIIAFGNTHYRYASGREGDWFVLGFAPRKASLTLYLTGATAHTDLLEKLGKYKTTGGCLYVKKLADVNQDILKELLARCAGGEGG
jgi:hypothetical protein